MKQNERLLVYAVTGFLALILIVAVIFGDDQARPDEQAKPASASLSDILKGEPSESSESSEAAVSATAEEVQGAVAGEQRSASLTGLNAPPEAKFEEPLRIPPPSPESRVRQKIGSYVRTRNFRQVQVKANDGWGMISQRWCGDASFVDEIKCLNESMIDLRAGQTVLVPWIDDEVLLAGLQVEVSPAMISGEPVPAVASASAGAAPTSASISPAGYPVSDVARSAADSKSVGGVVSHTVKSGESLWLILDRRFDARKIPSMIERCKELNPGKDVEDLHPGDQIKLPAGAE